MPRDPVVYQIYPRSFQDSDGDGVGDLPGITRRLDYLSALGVDAIWLSPIYQSPMADFGYDVSDHTAIDPVFGTIEDYGALVAEAHARDIGVLMDLILPHTSIAHPWFRDRPDLYFWADEVPNNWISVFGGPMWERDPASGRWYMHRFYPEQADLNWRNPAVRAAMYEVLRVWRQRGADGFRLDAIDGLYRRADLADIAPEAAERPYPYPLLAPDRGWSSQEHTGYDSHLPETFAELGRLRQAFPDAWFVAEAYRPISDIAPYVEHMDAAFNFEFLQAPFDAQRIGEIIRGSKGLRLAWTLSNHDFSRLVTRAGRDMARVAAVLVLTLPGAAFIYQGDEIGMVDGPGAATGVRLDRMGRDHYRHPMQWEAAGGFTTAAPWLPMIDPGVCNVADQLGVTDSMLTLYRSLVRLRRSLRGDAQVTQAADDLLVYRREDMMVACNFSNDERICEASELILHTVPGSGNRRLPPKSALIARVGT